MAVEMLTESPGGPNDEMFELDTIDVDGRTVVVTGATRWGAP